MSGDDAQPPGMRAQVNWGVPLHGGDVLSSHPMLLFNRTCPLAEDSGTPYMACKNSRPPESAKNLWHIA